MAHSWSISRISRRPGPGRQLLVVASLLLLIPTQGHAQTVGCTLEATGVPLREVVRCRDGLTIEATPGADYTLIDHNRDSTPDAASLRSGALLADVPRTGSARAFQITTPQAIAGVRGTQWAVDSSGSKTAVFVIEGKVLVRRQRVGAGVTLSPGEGVDVEPGTAPLQVKRWSAERAAALLARFGR